MSQVTRRGFGPRLLLTVVLAPAAVFAGADAGPRDFRAAEGALAAGDLGRFEALRGPLREHPLYLYLAYKALLAQPKDESAIEGFLDDYPDTHLAERLRGAYLDDLAAAGRWTDYLRVYRRSESAERQCWYLQALLATSRAEVVLSEAQMASLWLVPASQSAACDPVFAAWRAAGGLTSRLVWERIALTLTAGKPGLARYLGRQLPQSQQPLLERWLALRADPASLASSVSELAAQSHWMVPTILSDVIASLARVDGPAAADVLDGVSARLASDPAAWDRAHAAIGIALAEEGAPGERALGLALWDRMSAHDDNLDAQERRLRAAVRLGAWRRLVDWVERMPMSQAKTDRWLYWMARAQEGLGDTAATGTYRRAAGYRSLWGFLAADRLALPYAMGHRPVPADPARIRAIVTSPAYARLRALRRLGRSADMRREWRTLTRDMGSEDLMAAAYVADVLGWHDRAIFALADTGFWDDLRLRFPLEYRELVSEQAWQTGLPAPWIFALIRQESAFSADVASSAGALGLMQLMPNTARQMARDPGIDLASRSAGLSRWDILVPETNIVLGSAYLARMRDRFGHPALATAAYNAGPHRVDRWLPAHCMEADRWIMSIPFRETRGYVERVLGYLAIYSHRLGMSPVRLSSLLPPVQGREWWD